ncbi:hypothetical protein [Mycolicibacterium holsaticum]|uniref:PASTA domain-containing protein n=1 Tax=Mycolicibacterium holsaticum TaxID=152142 RepID=A0A1E3R9J1_9MYCO|nr:hypothetical protein [Mycolicibacterium holsaticum]MDA4107629.1 hypothetical protein [Mycolicibacterium holsaticum DSM 44478 = JCM 12374]ODQ86600.1 hypothetical protein BHQ17_20295 [Mycolicibacterium holsaticum]QZA14910.1 hypothetical protein K3U96_12900 [Mycolicibacterium holsaticum DSM 44478 = JCM 12374]UNC07652.1 hypothetical protein H5U41_13930 [Mycolicibacterium holsaticum DSM 44478 = JCM 12374]
MNKLVVLSGGLVAIGGAALVGAGIAMSQPAASTTLNVVGEPYNKALKILQAQGYKGYFGGSFGSVLAQSDCLVDTQKVTSRGRILLMLDCSQAAADRLEELGPSGGPRVGSNGVTTVTPTPVVPIQGAPGAGMAPPPPPPA